MNSQPEKSNLTSEDIKLINQSVSAPEQFEEMALSDVADVLSLTIKEEHDNKIVTFLCLLSAYTDRSQLNVSFNAASSTGKSYTAIQVADLFPEEDKIELSGASPTSFYHGEGTYIKELNLKVVSLERKILLFYEQPNPELQARLRPVLSHDKRELNFRITNPNKKGPTRAEKIVIRGFPATVFCSAGLRLDEQETTRAILLSPEITQEKIKAGIELEAQRSSDSRDYELKLELDPKRSALKRRIIAIRDEHIDDIIVPDPVAIVRRFNAQFKKAKPRHMRDMNHLMGLIKVAALLNVWQRRLPDGQVVASQADIDEVFSLWGRLFESQDLNVPPSVIHYYKVFILPAYEEKLLNPKNTEVMEKKLAGLSRQELAAYYFRKEGSPLNQEQLRKEILPQLEASGMITQQKPEEGDKRSPHIIPIWYPSQDKDPKKPNYVGKAPGEQYDLGDW